MEATLKPAQARRLRPHLEALAHEVDAGARVAADPIAFPRRYVDPADQEIAAFFSSTLAFGRVALFSRTLDTWFAWLDEGGGPAARLRDFEVDDATAILDLQYRWTRGPDLVLLMLATQVVLRRHGSLQAALPVEGDLRLRLEGLVQALRSSAVERAPEIGLNARSWADIPRGLKHLLPAPSGGSACKRWHMLLRWLVRADDGVDLGLWTCIDPRDLLIPVDTHVHRVARMLHLTDRRQADWRTAEQITANLRLIDADDPVRFDFALAHLGISGQCTGVRIREVCSACALRPVCAVYAG